MPEVDGDATGTCFPQPGKQKSRARNSHLRIEKLPLDNVRMIAEAGRRCQHLLELTGRIGIAKYGGSSNQDLSSGVDDLGHEGNIDPSINLDCATQLSPIEDFPCMTNLFSHV